MGGGLGWAAVGGGVRYRALACRASSGLLSLLLRSRPPPAREPEEGEEDLVEGETARGEQHNHHKQPWSQSTRGSDAHLLIWQGGLFQPVKLVVGDLRPFWGVGQKLGPSEAPLKNGLRGGAGVLTGDAVALIMGW